MTVERQVAAQNPGLAPIINLPSRDSHGAVPVAEWDIKGESPCLVSFCRKTLEMGVFQGVRAYVEALEWLSWLRNGAGKEGKKCREG